MSHQASTGELRRMRSANKDHIVYILSCADGTYYTGCTYDLQDRLKRHDSGSVPATCKRLPVALVSYTTFPGDKYKAYRFEKYLKSGSGRAFLMRHLV